MTNVDTVDVFVFSSDTITNIWAGFGSSTWAVKGGEASSMKGKITKSSRLIPGSFGLLYCKPWKAFTVPFVTTDVPDKEAIETDIWIGDWILPFNFKALGDPRKRLSGDGLAAVLDGMKRKDISNYSNYLSVQGNFDFQPSKIDRSDWSFILRQLT